MFAGLAPLTVLYAQGYRLDRENNRFIETGTIFLHSYPKNEALLFIDNKLLDQKKTPFQINGIEPGKYKIRIEKPGFFAWSKTLRVLPSLVTKAENIFLLPKNPKQIQINFAESIVSAFSISPNNKIIAYASALNVLLVNLDKEYEKDKFETYIFKKSSSDKIEQIIWSPDNKKLLLKTKKQWQILDIEKLKILDKSSTLNMSEPQWLNNKEIIYLNKNILYKFNLSSLLKPNKLLPKPVLSYSVSDNIIYYITKENPALYRLDIMLNKIEAISDVQFNLENPVFKIIVLNKDKIFVLTGDKFLYSFSKQEAEILGQNIADFHISPDNKKILMFNNREVYVYFLEDILDRDPQKLAKDLNLVAFFNAPILKQALWYKTSEHLILNLGDKIRFIELDERDKQNSVDFANRENIGEIIALEKKMYYSDGGNLYEVDLVVEE